MDLQFYNSKLRLHSVYFIFAQLHIILEEHVYYNFKKNVLIHHGWIKMFCSEISYKE